jgi:hypothetical protein
MGVDAEVNITNVKTTTKIPVYETSERVVDDGTETGIVKKESTSRITGY